jgi:uncharacterized short protein YbdD (DUF466 family)
MSQLIDLLYALWRYLKEAAGENDYQRYRARALERGAQLMTAKDFYDWQLRQKYSRINRCC